MLRLTIIGAAVVACLGSNAGEAAWGNQVNEWLITEASTSAFKPYDGGDREGMLGHFIRNMSIAPSGSIPLANVDFPGFEDGLRMFRLVQGSFPDTMQYHFDGLATILRFDFNATHLTWRWTAFESEADKDFEKCIFFGTGTGPTKPGRTICFKNPGVNLLPIQDQLWLTIDTLAWGRVDPETLETFPDARVGVDSMILNAHPACDRTSGECFVQHPCSLSPYTDQACVSRLAPKVTVDEPGRFDSNMQTELLSNASMPHKRLIQHSHSLCATPNFVVAKLDNFEPRLPGRVVGDQDRHGMLRYVHQRPSTEFMVMDRETKQSAVLEYDSFIVNGTPTTPEGFVNNHFWNCYEDPDPNVSIVVVESVAATEDYLDQYFASNLKKPTDWLKLFTPAIRCRVPTASGTSDGIICSPLGQSLPIFDYPTFNPTVKGQPYLYFYAIAAASDSSQWFDSLIKVNVSSASNAIVAASWSAPGVFLTEANFVPGWADDDSDVAEDFGTLLTVGYNATSDASFLAAFDARSLAMVELWDLGGVVPFHAHGIVCPAGASPTFDRSKGCYTNP